MSALNYYYFHKNLSTILLLIGTLFFIGPSVGQGEGQPECAENCQTACEIYGGYEPDYQWTGGDISYSVDFAFRRVVKVTGNTNLTSGPLKYSNCIFIISPGVKINIDYNVTFNNCIFFSCDAMWKGLTMKQSSKLTMTGCLIEDAQYAIDGNVFTQIWLTENRFNRNYIAININPTFVISPGPSIPPPPPSFNAFTGNVFECCNALNAAYPGQSPAPGVWTRTGIFSAYGGNSFGVGATKVNTFHCMNQGAELRNGAFTMEQCRFGYMTGPVAFNYRYNTGLALLDGSLDFTGLGTGVSTLPTFYHNTDYGLYTNNSYYTVKNSIFENHLRYCISSAGMINDEIHIHDNMTRNTIGTNYGNEIFLLGYSSVHQIRIENNTLINPFYGITMATGNHHNAAKIYNNTLSSMYGSCLLQKGNSVGSYQNLEVINNKANITAGGAHGGLIWLWPNSPGNFNTIENNTLTGFDPAKGGNAMLVESFNDGYFCKNTVDNFTNGIYFRNTCDKPQIRNTSFGHHKYGLYCKDAIFNNTQADFGNTWLTAPNYGTAAAYYEGLGYSSARFEAKSGNPYFPNPVNPVFGWFSISTKDPGDCPLHDPELADTGISDQQRMWIKNFDGSRQGGDAFREWYVLRNIYASLDKHPALMAGDPLLTEFYNTHRSGDIGKLYRFYEDMRYCIFPDASQQIQQDKWNNEIRDLNSQLADIDRSMAQGNYSDDLQAQKEGLLSRIAGLGMALARLDTTVRKQSLPCLQALASLNSGISADKDLTRYERQLNAITVRAAIEGRSEYTPEENREIEYIAGLCYDVAGLSPSKAIFMITDRDKREEYIRHYTDHCDGTESRSLAKPDGKGGLVVSPNPASGYIDINTTGIPGPLQVKIINSSGQLMYERSLDKSVTNPKIDISQWAQGLYFIGINNEIGCTQSGKFMIIR